MDRKFGSSDGLFIDPCSLSFERSAGANEVIYCGFPDNKRVSTDIGTGLSDPETELYHVRNRTYNPILGRWIQRDPIGYAGGAHLYEYVEGRAVGLADASGMLSVTSVVGLTTSGKIRVNFSLSQKECGVKALLNGNVIGRLAGQLNPGPHSIVVDGNAMLAARRGPVALESKHESGDLGFLAVQQQKKFSGVFGGRLFLEHSAPYVGVPYSGTVFYQHMRFGVPASGKLNVFEAGISDVFLLLGGLKADEMKYGDMAGGAVLSSSLGGFKANNAPIIFNPIYGAGNTPAMDWIATKNAWFSQTSISISLTVFFDRTLLFPNLPGSLGTNISIP